MRRKTKKVFLIVLLSLIVCVLFCACKKSDKDLITQAIETYLASIKEHDIIKTSSLISGDTFIFDPNNEELLKAAYYPIDDCYLESIEFPDSDDLSHISVTVHYIIVYSDDYIPIGSRTVGENKIKERFTLKKSDDQYTITGVEPIHDW